MSQFIILLALITGRGIILNIVIYLLYYIIVFFVLLLSCSVSYQYMHIIGTFNRLNNTLKKHCFPINSPK